MTDWAPTCLLYLLSVGKEHELVLRVYDAAPTEEELASWMRDGVVRGLLVAHEGDTETFTFIVNFGHVVAARVAPYSVTRTSSF
ncbi:MAG: hypothetical protein V7603_6287 [Micromonosporaceae bacterium]